MKGRTAVILYVLSAYVILQFIWWGYHIIDLTHEVSGDSIKVTKRVTMIFGEGAVFLLILVVGIWYVRKSIIKDIQLSQRQNNFLLSVTHELKTPLASNKLYIQTVVKRELSKEQRDQLLVKAIEENDRLERMIDNILNASRLENKMLDINKEPFDLKPLAQSSIDRFKQLAPEAIFQLNISENTQVYGDRLLVETMLNNLIENALKYAGRSSEIVVHGSQVDGKSIVKVTDNGPGVKPEEQEEIFKKFYRSGSEDTRTQKGTGLGLYIVSKLVRLHGGTIRYENNQPRGARFIIELNHD
jgi:two-component system, OmpR family, phosphate regulon sensor histidine kinase PhoR